MVAFLVGLGLGLVGGGAVVYLYYAKIVADLNTVVTTYKRAWTTSNRVVTDVKTDVEKAL